MGQDLRGRELGKGLRQRKDRRYEGRYVDRFGKRKSVFGASLDEVQIKLRDWSKSLRQLTGGSLICCFQEKYTERYIVCTSLKHIYDSLLIYRRKGRMIMAEEIFYRNKHATISLERYMEHCNSFEEFEKHWSDELL